MFKRFSNWITYSSTNPAEASATIRGLAKIVIPLIVIVLQSQGVDTSHIDPPTLVDQIVTAFLNILLLWGLVQATYGIIRKVVITLLGKSLV